MHHARIFSKEEALNLVVKGPLVLHRIITVVMTSQNVTYFTKRRPQLLAQNSTILHCTVYGFGGQKMTNVCRKKVD